MLPTMVRQLITAIGALLVVVSIAGAIPTRAVSTEPSPGLASQLVTELNQIREVHHLPLLLIDERLVAAARVKAATLAREQRFDHRLSDGRSPWELIRASGYRYELVGENLAIGFSNSGDITRAWLNSPTHRANLLDAGFSDVGIATAEETIDGRSTIIVAELFGRPDPRPALLRTVERSFSD